MGMTLLFFITFHALNVENYCGWVCGQDAAWVEDPAEISNAPFLKGEVPDLETLKN